ncbi:hypothetical protein [Thermobacillus composti]|jgi:hypothetical protein|uniref:hypothetical protein n=1 Tax=Thermobacillus composti TaxID=377615 RepID=UPI00022C3580|nr:hypothetical protein [Thermobacillus composti]
MATEAKPGKAIVLKLREDEEQLVIDWINKQTMYSDSIRYLIQKEIAENGLRNLQLFVPRIRTIETIKAQLMQTNVEKQHYQEPPSANDKLQQGHNPPPLQQTTVDHETFAHNNDGQSNISDVQSTPASLDTNSNEEEIKSPSNENQVRKRRAGKKFGSDVIQSFMN